MFNLFNTIGNNSGIGCPISPNQIGGENFIRHIADKLHYQFKEGSGTTCRDLSCEGNDGTFGAGAAAPTWKRNSLYFDGGDYVDLTGIAHGISTGEFTFCFHLNNFPEVDYVFDQLTARIAIFNRSTENYITFYHDGYNQVSDTEIDAILPISFQITRDVSTNLECYVNGRMQGKAQTESGDLTYDGTSVVMLGSNNAGSVFLTSTMYSFRILNKGLSGIECFQEYLSQKFKGNN